MPNLEAQQNLNSIPVLGFVPEQVTSDPGSPIEGRVWTRTDLHTLKVYLNSILKTLATTDDSRFTDSRTPTGSAGGDLTGTYPNPTLGTGSIDSLTLLTAALLGSADGGTATDGTAAVRSLGIAAHKALPGDTALNSITAPTGDVSLNSHKVTSLLDPTGAQDAATKNYVDGVAQGLSVKQSVRVLYKPSTWVVGNLTTAPNSVDGQSLSVADRVLVVDVGNTSAYNGIYVVNTVGTGANGVWARVADMDAWVEVYGAFTFVEQGTTYSNTGWTATVSTGGTLNTTAISFTQFSGAGTLAPGVGISITGGVISVSPDGTSIVTGSGTFRVGAGGVTNAMLAGSIDLTTKVTGALPVANGGTAATTAAAARTNLSAAGAFAGTSPALTAGTYADVAHSLGIAAKTVTFKVASTGAAVELDWQDKSGSATTTIQMKTDISGGRASGYYNVYVTA